jgi:hypothetical protein
MGRRLTGGVLIVDSLQKDECRRTGTCAEAGGGFEQVNIPLLLSFVVNSYVSYLFNAQCCAQPTTRLLEPEPVTAESIRHCTAVRLKVLITIERTEAQVDATKLECSRINYTSSHRRKVFFVTMVCKRLGPCCAIGGIRSPLLFTYFTSHVHMYGITIYAALRKAGLILF